MPPTIPVNPTLWDFCVSMIRIADIEGSKSNVAMNAWLQSKKLTLNQKHTVMQTQSNGKHPWQMLETL